MLVVLGTVSIETVVDMMVGSLNQRDNKVLVAAVVACITAVQAYYQFQGTL